MYCKIQVSGPIHQTFFCTSGCLPVQHGVPAPVPLFMSSKCRNIKLTFGPQKATAKEVSNIAFSNNYV